MNTGTANVDTWQVKAYLGAGDSFVGGTGAGFVQTGSVVTVSNTTASEPLQPGFVSVAQFQGLNNGSHATVRCH